MDKKTIGIVGGLGTLSGGDIFFKLLKSKTVLQNQQKFHFLFEQHPYPQINSVLENESDVSSRKFYAYTICKVFEDKKVDKILLPCFASHTFIEQLQTELNLPIVNMMDALDAYLSEKFEKGTKIGVLASNYVKTSTLFESYFKNFSIYFPKSQDQIMEAVYGEKGIKNGYLDGLNVESVHQVCQDLIDEGCTVILPGVTELSLISDQLWKRGVKIIDVNQVYADYAIDTDSINHLKPFKLGVLGGVGPAATVDFMSKVIKNTPAKKDQDHIKMIVEQNPQIPDRTANLVYNEPDPTIAMFSTCKQLEAEGAEAIAIPCNTAHAFVDRIQPYLNVPIINMLNVTIEHIIQEYGDNVPIGLTATTGTVLSGVYDQIASLHNLDLIIPDEMHQEAVMNSTYSSYGVKAGFTSGKCLEDITKAINHLVERGAGIVILGCTELPIMFSGKTELLTSKGISIPLIDPTNVLAKACVNLALKS